MSFDQTINAYFVTTSAEQQLANAAGELLTSMTLLRNHILEENIRQIKASEGFPLIAAGGLTKKDVFIFDKFEGDFFQQLQQTKCLIVGPRCLCSCLIKCEPIPLGTSPVYTTAMRDLQISATGITPQEKERLRELIQWMGGHYFQNFGRSITHLVSNTIKSTKYEHATLNGVAVMHVDWVQRVWERSCLDNVSATDAEFHKYRLPIFFGTNITCTGLETDKKDKVMRLVNENGGTYHRAFRSQLVDIVITEKTKTNSDKYQAAVRYKKEILLPEWIFHSVEKGFALPTKGYQVKSMKVSTPTKTDQSIADFTSTDQSQLSDISRISTFGSKLVLGVPKGNITMSDTICSLNDTQTSSAAAQHNTFVAPAVPNLKRDNLKKMGTNYRQIFDEICPKKAKKAGTFLDGCCIYLSGFRPEEKEKLNKILNAGGAPRYDNVNEKITHIIVGQMDDAEFRNWQRDGILNSVIIVRLDWLLESIRQKQPASETLYRISLPTSFREPDAPSPSSKRTLRSMNHSFKQPDLPIRKKLFEPEITPIAKTKEIGSNSSLIPSDQHSPFADADVDDEQNFIAQYSQQQEPIVTPLPQSKTMDQQPERPLASSVHGNVDKQLSPSAAAATSQQSKAPPESSVTGMCTIDYENLDFFHGVSVYIDKSHFPAEFYTQMINECEAAQGNVVAATFRDPVDYAIVSFECTFDESTLLVKARHIITELYVETCMKQNKLVAIQYFHKHIPHTADAQPLKGMTIVVSLYTGLERDYVESLAQLLGATVNKTFVKKERPLLVCPLPEGSKYEGALKWRYPVVTSEWLVHCASEGIKLEFRNYLVGNSPDDFPIPAVLKERNNQNQPSSGDNLHINPEPVETNIAAPPLTTEITPLRNKRVAELAAPMRGGNSANSGSTPDSPHTPPNNHGSRPSYNFDLMDNILAEIENEAERECLREVIMEMRNNQTPELERIRRQACTPINRKIPTPKGIPDFCTTPEFEKRMADEFERRWRLPTKKMKPDTPIDEIRKRVMRATCRALGLAFSSDEEQQQRKKDKTSTNKTSETTPFRNGDITPRTIFARNSLENVKASDTLVPNTQTPNNNNNNNNNSGQQEQQNNTASGSRISDAVVHTSIGGKLSTINFDKISFEETGAENNSNSDCNNKQSLLASSPELKQITDYLKNCEMRRQSLKERCSVSMLSGHQTSSGVENIDMMSVVDPPVQYVQPFESEQFNAGGTEEMVIWRDPAEFSLERRRLAAVSSIQYRGTPRFSISCIDEDTRADLISRIIRLGGEVCVNLVNFDPECTHFICERPNRGEKMLGCISSGKWVLSVKYIDECSAKGVFIDEELYEWGNPKAYNIPKLTNDEMVIASAAHRWRKQLSVSDNSTNAGRQEQQSSIESVGGAFSGFRAILRISERNYDALKNVIKAGKGEIIEAQSPYAQSPDAYKATHCFVDVKKAPLPLSDYKFLRESGIHVLTQMYINSHLMNGSNADYEKYEIKM